MNEKIVAFVFGGLGLLILFLGLFFTTWFLTELSIVVLGIWVLLISFWTYVDEDRHQEDLEYMGGRIAELEKHLDAKIIAETSVEGRKSMWVCPNCKAINTAEEKICHHCKRPISQTT